MKNSQVNKNHVDDKNGNDGDSNSNNCTHNPSHGWGEGS